MSRAEREAEARRLRDEGLLGREIAERMGVSTSTVSAWLTDPGGRRLRARKDSYRGICDTCGGSTDGSDGPGKAPSRCAECLRWSREAILEAIADWADEHGGIPPRCIDTGVGYEGHGRLPASTVVKKYFGTWNAALLAGGFELHCDRRSETQEEIMAALRAGESVRSIADRFGVTSKAIGQRLRVRGLTVADVRSEPSREAA
jgi:transcriptional regulator with XRE-family HTH domain